MMERLDDFLLIGNDKLFKIFSKEELLKKIAAELSKNPPLQQDPQGSCEELIKAAVENNSKKDELGAVLVVFNFAITAGTNLE